MCVISSSGDAGCTMARDKRRVPVDDLGDFWACRPRVYQIAGTMDHLAQFGDQHLGVYR